MSFFDGLLRQKIFPLLLRASLMGLGVGVMMVSNTTSSAIAAEEIIFKNGIASQSVSIEDLENFTDQGNLSPSLKFFFDLSKQEPQVARYILNQELPADPILIANLLHSMAGEFALGETSQIVHSKSKRANVQALRGALIQSASDDNKVSLLEILQNYPTQQVYVEGRVLAKAASNVNDFINTQAKYNYFQVPVRYLKELVDGL